MKNREEYTGKFESLDNIVYILVKSSWASIFKKFFKTLELCN